MRKLLLTLIGLLFISNIDAQVITGFSNVTDTDGNTHSLSNYLNDGKYVVLNFYLYNCGNCIATAPEIESIYNDYGQNQCNVVVLSFNVPMSSSDPSTNALCDSWAMQYGISSPPNFTGAEGSAYWWSQLSVNGTFFAQTYLITPNGDSVIYVHSGGVLDHVALRDMLDDSIPELTSTSNVTVTNSYTWNGIIYTTSGVYTYNTTNLNGCDSTAILDLTITNISTVLDIKNNTKTMLKVIDILGRERKGTKNEPLFYIYDDGTVEKKIILE